MVVLFAVFASENLREWLAGGCLQHIEMALRKSLGASVVRHWSSFINHRHAHLNGA